MVSLYRDNFKVLADWKQGDILITNDSRGTVEPSTFWTRRAYSFNPETVKATFDKAIAHLKATPDEELRSVMSDCLGNMLKMSETLKERHQQVIKSVYDIAKGFLNARPPAPTAPFNPKRLVSTSQDDQAQKVAELHREVTAPQAVPTFVSQMAHAALEGRSKLSQTPERLKLINQADGVVLESTGTVDESAPKKELAVKTTPHVAWTPKVSTKPARKLKVRTGFQLLKNVFCNGSNIDILTSSIANNGLRPVGPARPPITESDKNRALLTERLIIRRGRIASKDGTV